jgi:primosomal protein N' (replication factor Y) (superfamily II helicase)
VSRYYLAPIGEAFRAMLPPEIELRHDREYSITDAGRAYLAQFLSGIEATGTEGEDLALLREFEVKDEPISSARMSRLGGGEAAAERLIRRGFLVARDVVRQRKSRTQKIVAWNLEANQATAADSESSTADAEANHRASDKASAKGSAEARVREILTATRGPLPLAHLIEKAKVSRTVIQRLEKAGRVVTWEEPLTPDEDPWDSDFTPTVNVLNSEQNQALAEIWRWLVDDKFAAGLLHGVTGSGKTEVYLGAVEATLSRGKSAIVLVPEIALTLWLSRLVRARFGPSIAVLHSGLADVERAREWWRVRNGEARVVVGTRSAVFAPLEKLGLIIVDEEQESAYKQEETPRYNGRDVAVYRARMENAVALLGSATPSRPGNIACSPSLNVLLTGHSPRFA